MSNSNQRWDDLLSLWEAHCKRENRDVSAQEIWPDASPEDLAEFERKLQAQRLVRGLFDLPVPPELAASAAETAYVPGYELVKLLGKGGFGEVWKARRTGGYHPYVALKLVDLNRTGAEVEKWALDVMKDLHDLHMVPISAAWRDDHRLYIEMELAERTLLDRFNEEVQQGRQGIGAEELFGYLNDAAKGIDWLNEPHHIVNGERGYRIFHRDIKPTNLLLIGTRVKVADFGVCRASQHTLTGQVGGMTRAYAPPEFFKGAAHGRSDQYSLAVTYCHLRGGRLPFQASAAEEWMYRHLYDSPDLTMLPEAERSVVAKALAKEPSARWMSCKEFVASLRAGQQPESVLPAASPPAASSVPELSPYFTGRKAELEQLRRAFTEQPADGGPQVQVLSGQGGNGKTQLAVKYASRYRKAYKAVFWIRAASSAECMSGFAGIARQLGLPEAQEAEQARAVAAAHRWLENEPGWLLVLDNADEPQQVKEYIPRNDTGHTLVTSRAQAFDMLGCRAIRVPLFSPEEAVQFLLERTEQENLGSDELTAAAKLCQELGYLPLALEQVGAYVLAHQARFQDYLSSYRNSRLKTLGKKPPVAGNYPYSVEKTYRLSIDQVKKTSPAAIDLLKVSALLHSDAIPLEFLERGAKHLGAAIARFLSRREDDPVILDELLEPLTKYSLVQRDRRARTFSMHSLVQEVLRAEMRGKQQARWAERVVRAMAAVFPSTEFHNWPLCERLLPHALCCAGHVEKWEFDFQEVGRLLDDTGVYLEAHGQFVQSDPLLRRSLTIREKALGLDHPEVAQSLNGLGVLLYRQGKYTEAQPLHQRALAIREKALGPEHPDVGRSLNNLVALLYLQDKCTEAQPLCERALAIREKALGPEHPDVGKSLNNLAALLHDQSKYTEAQPVLERAVAILEKALGPEHPSVAYSLNNLAEVLREQGKYTEAQSLNERGLTIREKALGPEHPEVARSLHDLADILNDQRKYSEAHSLHVRALAIREKALGPEHPDVAQSLNGLAEVLREQGKSTEAQPLCERALAIREKALGSEHPDVAQSLGNLADLLGGKGQYDEAQPLCERALAIREKALGSEHPDVAKSLNSLAGLLKDQDKYIDAQPLYERALAIREKVLGSEHPDVAKSLVNLAELFKDQGKDTEAEPLLARALTIREKPLEPGNHDIS